MGGGGHSGTKWIPTAKRPCRTEVVSAKIDGGRQLIQSKEGDGHL